VLRRALVDRTAYGILYGMAPSVFDPGAEYDRQVQNLLGRGYAGLAGLTDDGFVELVAPLRQTALAHGTSMDPPKPARLPFALVVSKELVTADQVMPQTTLAGRSKPGLVDRNYAAGELSRFNPLKELEIPDGKVYLVFDIDRGEEFLNVTPDDAMDTITARLRTPLTWDEGVALITHFPASLERNRCFSLAGSRCGDRRVPALWISEGAPKLGWCWAGNPHTWLGTASCGGRAGPR